jgi:hypothetical protein
MDRTSALFVAFLFSSVLVVVGLALLGMLLLGIYAVVDVAMQGETGLHAVVVVSVLIALFTVATYAKIREEA